MVLVAGDASQPNALSQLTNPPFLDGLMNDHPDPDSFITTDDAAGTTLVDGSTFERPLDLNESNPNSVNGNDDDQRPQFNDITSHMSSTSTQTYDGVLDLDESLVGHDEPLEVQWPSPFPTRLDQEPPLEQHPDLGYQLESYHQTPYHHQPLSDSQPPFLPQPLFPQQVPRQYPVPSGPVHGAPYTRGEMSQLHPVDGAGPDLLSWTNNIYVPGLGHRNQRDSSQLCPTTSLPELDLQAAHGTAGPAPTPYLGFPSGRGLYSSAPSLAAISSDATAFNSQVSAVGGQTYDSSLVKCNRCSAEYYGKRKKRSMLYVAL
jgi:hypothetical protein